MILRRNFPPSKLNKRSAPDDLLLLHQPQAECHQEASLFHFSARPLNPENPITSVLINSKQLAPVINADKDDSEFSFKQNYILSQEDPQNLEGMKVKNLQNKQIISKQLLEKHLMRQRRQQKQSIQTNHQQKSSRIRGKRCVGRLTNTPFNPLSLASEAAEPIAIKPLNSSFGSSRFEDVLSKITSLRLNPLETQSHKSQRKSTHRYESSKAYSTDTSREEHDPIKKSVINTIRKHVEQMSIPTPKYHKICQEQDSENLSLIFNKPFERYRKVEVEQLLEGKNRSFLVRSTNKKTRKQAETIIVSYRTTILELKQLCQRYDQSMKIKITVPSQFLDTIFDPKDSQEQMFQKAINLLEVLGVQSIQPMTIRKYSNCVIVLIDQLTLISHYSGQTYFGGWLRGGKSGLGLEWLPGQFVYYGQFKNNKRQGYGIMKDFKGKIQLGRWKENQVFWKEKL